MRITLNLSVFAFLWLSLISASSRDLTMDQTTFELDVKMICKENLVECVCNHGAEPCRGPYYKIKLSLSHAAHDDKSLELIMKQAMGVIIQQFQGEALLSTRHKFRCSSMKLVKKDAANPDDDEYEALLQASMLEVLGRSDTIKNLALEINLESEWIGK